MKYLIGCTNTVRLSTLNEVEEFHEELKHENKFQLNNFSWTLKEIKKKGEVVDEYFLVKYKITFTNEKDPEVQYEVEYNEI